jgi:hypothetical protein
MTDASASDIAIFYPAAVLLFWYCLDGYRKSVAEAGKWHLN